MAIRIRIGTRKSVMALAQTEEIARRLAKARDEIAAYGKYYDFCVLNESVEIAGREVQAIVTALRCSTERRRAWVEKLLASFGGERLR